LLFGFSFCEGLEVFTSLTVRFVEVSSLLLPDDFSGVVEEEVLGI